MTILQSMNKNKFHVLNMYIKLKNSMYVYSLYKCKNDIFCISTVLGFSRETEH